MARLWVATACSVVPLIASCAFIIDFDELQQGNRGSVDGGPSAGGAAGAGGAAAAGADAGPTCPNDCDDSDPCTADECTAIGCEHTQLAGLFPDGLDETFPAEKFHRVTMTSRGDRFYLSALQSMGAQFDLILTSFGKEDGSVMSPLRLSTATDLGGAQPISAAGLVSPSQAFELVAYVALGFDPNLPGQVAKITFDLDLNHRETIPASETDNYGGGVRVHPIAWQPPGGQVWGAWPGASGGIFLHTARNTILPDAMPTLGRAQLTKATALAPLAADDQPAVLWANAAGVFAQAVGQLLPATIGQCTQAPGTILSAASAFTPLEGIYLVNWTKATMSSVVTELVPVLCGGALGRSCVASDQCSMNQEIFDFVRNQVLEIVTIQGDPAGRLYQILASPFIDEAGEGAIALQAFRADFDPTNPESEPETLLLTEEPVELSRMPLGPGGEGPDWPALSVITPDRVGVAWIEPSTAGEGDALRVQRHRLCLPE